MIIQEHFDVNGYDFIRTYSDVGKYVIRDGLEYSEACDPAEFNRQYIEGDLMEEEEQLEYVQKILNILLGGKYE